jgi:hypothetical protein
LRPQARCELVTDADVHPEILRLYPNVVDELNACPVDVWRGEGRPGRGWDGWEYEHVPLDEALAFQTEGEA